MNEKAVAVGKAVGGIALIGTGTALVLSTTGEATEERGVDIAKIIGGLALLGATSMVLVAVSHNLRTRIKKTARGE